MPRPSPIRNSIVQGYPPPTIEWHRQGAEHKNKKLDDRYSVTPKGLYLKHVLVADAGEYQVTLTNDAGSVAATVELKVKCKSYVFPSLIFFLLFYYYFCTYK